MDGIHDKMLTHAMGKGKGDCPDGFHGFEWARGSPRISVGRRLPPEWEGRAGAPPPMHGMGRGVMAWGFPWWDSTPVECFAGDKVLQLP